MRPCKSCEVTRLKEIYLTNELDASFAFRAAVPWRETSFVPSMASYRDDRLKEPKGTLSQTSGE